MWVWHADRAGAFTPQSRAHGVPFHLGVDRVHVDWIVIPDLSIHLSIVLLVLFRCVQRGRPVDTDR